MTINIPTSIPTEEINGDQYVRVGKDGLKILSSIKAEHIEEDELVRRLTAEAAEISAILSAFRAKVFGEVAAYRELLADKYKVKRRGKKGNITLTTVDTSLRISIAIGETMELGPELEVAKELIDNLIRAWSAGSNNNIRALVDDAFKVDQKGKLNTDRILGLRRLKIVDETGDWDKAMHIIGESVRPMFSKEYARFYMVDKQTGDDMPIKLDLANA